MYVDKYVYVCIERPFDGIYGYLTEVDIYDSFDVLLFMFLLIVLSIVHKDNGFFTDRCTDLVYCSLLVDRIHEMQALILITI